MTAAPHWSPLDDDTAARANAEAIWANVLANPGAPSEEPFHGDLIPDVEFLSDVESDMRAGREEKQREVAGR